MITLFSFVLRSVKVLFVFICVFFYFNSFYFSFKRLKEVCFEDSSIKGFKICILISVVVYLIVLFLFQKIYLKKEVLRSLVFALLINFLVILSLFIVSFLLLNNDLVIDIPLERSVPYLVSDVDSEQINKDVLNMEPEKVKEFQHLIGFMIISISIMFFITVVKTFLIFKRVY